MVSTKPLLLLSFLFHYGHGFGFRGFHFHGLEEPQSLNQAELQNISEEWIQQPLDHFLPNDNRTWPMRYFKNSGYFKPGGPILIMIGGEWAIGSGFLQSGQMYELGTVHHGMMYYTEHRFYGKSKPTPDRSAKYLAYLSVEQALADLAHFIETKKKDDKLKNSPVIVFGGSYAGNMAAWMRLKYPNLVHGALASSAPVLAKLDFKEYFEVVTEALEKNSEECADSVKTALQDAEKMLKDYAGIIELKLLFKLCTVPDINSKSDVAYFMQILSESFASIVQYNSVDNDGKTKIQACCETMTAKHLGTPLMRLANLVSGNVNSCLMNSYQAFVKAYGNVAWTTDEDTMRQWFYQTCTEFGYFQTTNSAKSIFGSLVDVNYYINVCEDLYDRLFNESYVSKKIENTNSLYGGLHPNLKNVIFTNGDVDPWHSLSILTDLNQFSPAFLIKGASHCSDLYSNVPSDSAEVVETRSKLQKIIGSWITSKSFISERME